MVLTDFSKMASVDSLMPVNPLPPQAYTKETLQKAYTWLLTQSPAIKEIASSQDMMISLYLKAQRNGDASLETPSIQNFKQELKSLASIMGDLQPTPAASNFSASYSQATAATAAPLQSTQQTHQPHATATSVSVSALTSSLDPASLQAINDVKQTLNLSSDTEALRALIALGYKQFKKI